MAHTPHSHLATPPLGSVPFSRPGTPTHKEPPVIGFIGIGAMGYFMARNLANHRHSHPAGSSPLLLWNRTASKAEDLAKELGPNKARVARDLAEIAVDADVIVTNLASDEVVKSVYNELVKALTEHTPTKPKIFVETSTIHPSLAGEIDAKISHFRLSHFVTSPVFGAPNAADHAQLIVVLAGDYRSKKEIAYLFVPAIGRKAYDLGGNIEKACTFKLIGNSMILGCLEVMAEAFTMGEKAGIEGRYTQQIIEDLLPAPPLVRYSKKMLEDEFDGSQGFAIDGGIKDATHLRTLSTALSCPMPTVDIAHQHLLTARSIHTSQQLAGRAKYGTLDWSAVIAGSRVAAGLDPFDHGKNERVQRED